MKEDKHLARILARLKIDPSTIKNPNIEADYSQEAEAVIEFVKQPKRFTLRHCGECGAEFATDYGSVGYCSNKCRKAHLETLGIQWDYSKSPHERWGYRFPLTVGPDALAALRNLASVLLADEQQPERMLDPVQ